MADYAVFWRRNRRASRSGITAIVVGVAAAAALAFGPFVLRSEEHSFLGLAGIAVVLALVNIVAVHGELSSLKCPRCRHRIAPGGIWAVLRTQCAECGLKAGEPVQLPSVVFTVRRGSRHSSLDTRLGPAFPIWTHLRFLESMPDVEPEPMTLQELSEEVLPTLHRDNVRLALDYNGDDETTPLLTAEEVERYLQRRLPGVPGARH